MDARLIVVLFIICSACQSGILPCPKATTVKIKKSNRFYQPTYSLSAKAEADEEQHANVRNSKSTIKVVSHVSLEEWDCPKPGSKKYLPKAVKQNIRKNMKKINSNDETESKADSLQRAPFQNPAR